LPHVVRKCEECGRELRVHEPGAHGIGFKIRKGDQVVLPLQWLKPSLNPLKSTAQFPRYGLQWFAEQIHFEDLPRKKNEIAPEIDRLEAQCDQILSSSSVLAGLDLSNPDHADQIIAKLIERQDRVEWWAFLMGFWCIKGAQSEESQQFGSSAGLEFVYI